MHARFISACLGLGMLAVAGCQSTPPPLSTGTSAATTTPPALPAGAARYRIRAALSEIRILVYRAGPLSRFGHNHVIQAGGITGEIYVAKDFQQSAFELSLPVKDLVVDSPAARETEGPDFAGQPSLDAVDGTYRNMLGPNELDAGRYPEITLRSLSLIGPEWGPDVTLRISLHGVDRDMKVPVSLERETDRIVVGGSFAILQTDFGIKPLSLFGGGLQVADKLHIRFRLVATPDY